MVLFLCNLGGMSRWQTDTGHTYSDDMLHHQALAILAMQRASAFVMTVLTRSTGSSLPSIRLALTNMICRRLACSTHTLSLLVLLRALPSTSEDTVEIVIESVESFIR